MVGHKNTLLVAVKPRKHIQVGSRTTEFTLVDCPTVDDCLNRPKKQWQVEARKKTDFLSDFSIRFAEFVGCDTVVDDEGEELDEATKEKIKKQFGGFQFPKLEKILTNKRYLDISAYYAEDELGETFIFDDDKTLKETEADSVIAKIGYFFEGFYFSGRNLKIVRGNSMAGKYQEVQEANVSARPNRRQHLILDTEYGEVMLIQNGDYCEVYIGDNYDDYVGDVDCKLSDNETVVRKKVSELFS